jgi:hypothetical protein
VVAGLGADLDLGNLPDFFRTDDAAGLLSGPAEEGTPAWGTTAPASSTDAHHSAFDDDALLSNMLGELLDESHQPPAATPASVPAVTATVAASSMDAESKDFAFEPTVSSEGPGAGVWCFEPWGAYADRPAIEHPTVQALLHMGVPPPPQATSGSRMRDEDVRKVAAIHAFQLSMTGALSPGALHYLHALRCKRAHIQNAAHTRALAAGVGPAGPPPAHPATLFMPITPERASEIVRDSFQEKGEQLKRRDDWTKAHHAMGQTKGGDLRTPRQLLRLEPRTSHREGEEEASPTEDEAAALWRSRAAIDATFSTFLSLSDARFALNAVSAPGGGGGHAATRAAALASKVQELQLALALSMRLREKKDPKEAGEAIEDEDIDDGFRMMLKTTTVASAESVDAGVSDLVRVSKGKRLLCRVGPVLHPVDLETLLQGCMRQLIVVVCSEADGAEADEANARLAAAVSTWIGSPTIGASFHHEEGGSAPLASLCVLLRNFIDSEDGEMLNSLLHHPLGAQVFQALLNRGEVEASRADAVGRMPGHPQAASATKRAAEWRALTEELGSKVSGHA